MVFAVVVILAAVIIIGWFIGQSNRLNRYVVSIEESKKTVDITLAKRYDTISEMLKVAKAYAKHEEKVFTELVGLRQSASIQETNRAMANQNDVLSQIRAVAENYPDLMSSQQFLTLQKEIASENEPGNRKLPDLSCRRLQGDEQVRLLGGGSGREEGSEGSGLQHRLGVSSQEAFLLA